MSYIGSLKLKKQSIIRSVWIKKGPDVIYYDLCFEKLHIKLIYLGSIWTTFRPRTGLPKKEDVITYRLFKERRRQKNIISKNDITIPYSKIREYRLKRIVEYKQHRRAEKKLVSLLELQLTSGESIQIYFSSKVYDKMKTLLRRHIVNKV